MTWVWLLLMSKACLGTTPSLPTAYNRPHLSPTCPSGRLVTNLSLKSNLRFQVTFVTNSSSLALGPGLDWDTLTRGKRAHYPSSHVCTRSENPIQLMVVIRVTSSLVNSRKGIHNCRPEVWDTTFHTCSFAALCRKPPLGWGRSRTLLENLDF